MRAHRSLSGLLAGVYLLLIVYASLYPFEGWRWPAGAAAVDLLRLPWAPWRHPFDEWANFIGYVPLGAVLFAVVARNRGSLVLAVLLGVLGPALLSYGLELLQNFVPRRYPSLRDWMHNALGGVVGAAFAWLAQAAGWLDHWQRVRERWFLPHSAVAMTLLLLWPVGLLFPSPVPLGLGHIGPELRALVLAAVASTPFEAPVGGWLDTVGSGIRVLNPSREAVAVSLGLAAPCLLGHVVTRTGWRRWLIAPATAGVAVATMTLSTALNFGPDHALTWMTAATLKSIGMATVVCLMLGWVPPRLCAALALVAITALVFIVAEAPADPYYAASLMAWEQGRFIHFHGLAQWVGMLWPYAALGWLVTRLARRD